MAATRDDPRDRPTADPASDSSAWSDDATDPSWMKTESSRPAQHDTDRAHADQTVQSEDSPAPRPGIASEHDELLARLPRLGAQASASLDEPRTDDEQTIDSADGAGRNAPAGNSQAEAPAAVGPYRVVERLGSGSFGEVLLGHDPVLDRRVAVKRLRGALLANPVGRESLRHEAQAIVKLDDHPGIVRLLHLVESDDSDALVLEYVDGPTMDRLVKGRPAGDAEAIEWIAQIAEALDYAHRNEVVHRDLKPANVLMKTGADGRVRPLVTDFGLATLQNRSWQEGRGQVVGSPAYMSPEQASRQSEWATPQSDIFSLGVMLYEVLTGKLPFAGEDRAALLDEICDKTPALPRSLNDGVSVELNDACMRALEKDPTRRHRSAGDFAAALRGGLAPEPDVEPTDTTRGAIPGLAAVAAGAVVLLTLLATTWDGFSRSDESSKGGESRDSPVSPIDDSEPEQKLINSPLPEVRLAIDVQFGGESPPARLSGSTDDLEVGDRFRVTAEIDKPAYLYAVWRRPNGDATFLSRPIGGQTQKVLQTPSVADLPWRALNDGASEGDAVGKHLLVAFCVRKPLTTDEEAELLAAEWRTEVNQAASRAFSRSGYPAITSSDDVRRGGPPVQPTSAVDPYLGDLTDALRTNLKAHYQAQVFHVHPQGYRESE